MSQVRTSLLSMLLLALAWSGTGSAYGQAAGTRYALLVGGLGGDPAYTQRFRSYLSETRTLLVDRFDVPADHVYVLGEQQVAEQSFVDDVSTAENIRSYVERVVQRATPDDHVYFILFGHGSYDGTHARLNIPRRDLDDADYAALLDELDVGRVVFVNTASASGPFATALSASDRIVITATATGTERDETVFPRYFVEALRSADADLDKNGGLSVYEVFVYATEKAARSFEAAGHLATEHALLDDNGDGTATPFDELDGSGDGNLAALTYLRPPRATVSVREDARPLLREKEALEQSIAELKSRKASMREDSYYTELESLFVRLARLNQRIEAEQ